MKKRIISLRTIASTLLLAITTAFFLTSVPASAKPVPITSQEVKITPTDLPVATAGNNYQHAVKEKENGNIINSGNFAEKPAGTKMPQLYAKKIYTGADKNKTTAATGNYRGKQSLNRMM